MVINMLARYRYRIEPTQAQRAMLTRTFGCARVVFNDAIRVREQAYRAGEKLSPVPSVRDAHRAFSNFFDSVNGRRRGRKVGKPRFKSRKDYRQSARFTRNGFTIRPGGRLYLAKIGEVKVRWSRGLASEPSSVTVIREPDGHFYASFVVDVQPTPLPVTAREAGVDLGVARLATVADTAGRRTDVANPRHLAGKLRVLRRLGREKARRAKGGANRAKTRRKIAIEHGKVARARRDHHHKQALRLVRDNQAVHVEDLNIVGMAGNRRLARAILDAGWAQFVRILEENAERNGHTVHKVSCWLPSSETCSGCGRVMNTMPLRVRSWVCPGCGTSHDRDHNAAGNILAAGRAERRNACGAGVGPSARMAVGDEPGSTPDAA